MFEKKYKKSIIVIFSFTKTLKRMMAYFKIKYFWYLFIIKKDIKRNIIENLSTPNLSKKVR